MFVPGDSEKKMEKCFQIEADVIIFDLEDAVSSDQKESARELILSFKKRHPVFPKPLFVRINPVASTDYEADMKLLHHMGPDGILLPKTESAEQVQFTAQRVKCELVPMIESALGLFRIHDIASASPQITHLTFGSLDFCLDMNMEPSSDGQELHYIRYMLALASRLAKLNFPIDTVYSDFRDQEGFDKEAQRVRRLGFEGKLLIHPGQIESSNRLFRPTDVQLDWAERVISAIESASTKGEAVIQLDGEMIDAPVYKRAKKWEPYIMARKQ